LEFALVIPLLMLLVFGVIDLGIVMSQKASLANGVRSGARYGAVNAYTTAHTCQSVVDRVRAGSQTMGTSGSNASRIAVTVTRDGASICAAAAGATTATGTGVLAAPCKDAAGTPSTPDTLTVSASFVSDLPVPLPGFGGSVTIANSSAFQCEYY
jgi:Flp pilus assembly protein TadG